MGKKNKSKAAKAQAAAANTSTSSTEPSSSAGAAAPVNDSSSSSSEVPVASGSTSRPIALRPPRAPPIAPPSAGSANPAANFSSLWNFMAPALDHILTSPTNDVSKAPAIDVAYHMGIHTNVYNYFTAQSDMSSYSNLPRPNYARPYSSPIAFEKSNASPSGPTSGTDLYERLDQYYADITREALASVPQDSDVLVQYIVPAFSRYSAGVHSINRLLNYVNRHYVKRSVDEDRGWLRLGDVIESVAQQIRELDPRDKIADKLKERRRDQLKRWGYEDDGGPEQLAAAEACAEAASDLDRIVPLSSLGLRRWRTELLEPLLSVPKIKGKVKRKPNAPMINGDKVLGPKGRLARAVKELLEREDSHEPEIRRLVQSLSDQLRTTGVRSDHPLRKRIEKFLHDSEPEPSEEG